MRGPCSGAVEISPGIETGCGGDVLTSAAVLELLREEGRRPLADHDAGRHRVACGYAWHDGGVGDAKAFHPIDLQRAVHDRHGVAAHLRRAGLVPEGAKPVTKEPIELLDVETARSYLAPREGPQGRGIANRARHADTGRQILQALRIVEVGSVGFGPVRWIAPRLFGRIPIISDQEAAGGLKRTAFSAVTSGPRRA